MKDFVAVLAYWRPNYIERCLNLLAACKETKDCSVVVFQDDREDLPQNRRTLHNETGEIIGQTCLKHHFDYVWRHPHDFSRTTDATQRHACSLNSFLALRLAYEMEAPYTFLIADDIFVTPDFFRWHKAVQEDSKCFSSVAERAWRDHRIPENKDVGAYFRAETNLMDGGMCWRRDNLGKLLRYPSHTIVDHRFPPIPEMESRPMIPIQQRAFHVGKRSSYALTDEFTERGDVDEIPERMPEYSWAEVFEVKA